MDTPLKNVLIIPQKATFEILDHRYVYVVGKDNVIRTTPIKIDQEMQHLFVIGEGITENDHILLEGLRKVKDQDEVDPKFVPADSVVKHLGLYAE